MIITTVGHERPQGWSKGKEFLGFKAYRFDLCDPSDPPLFLSTLLLHPIPSPLPPGQSDNSELANIIPKNEGKA